MRVFGYVRVSTGEQALHGVGLEAQRDAITRDCERRGWDLVRVFEDAGFSAATMKRPALQEALKRLKRGEAGVLLVSKLDRLSRSLEDYVGLRAAAVKQGWSPAAMDLPVDVESPVGEAMLNLGVVFAQLERRLISQRTKDALAVKKAQGVRLGRPSLLTDAERLHVIELAEAHGFCPAARLLNEEGARTGAGGRCWYGSSVRSLVMSA